MLRSAVVLCVFVTSLLSSFDVMDFFPPTPGTNSASEYDNVVTMFSSKYSSQSFKHYETENSVSENSEQDVHNVREIIYNFQYLDARSCPPCICYQRKDNSVDADCSNRQFLRMPTKLPVTIKTLNMSLNRMVELNTSNLTKYSQLGSLILRSNPRLIKVSGQSQENISSAMTTLDLSYNNISTIEDSSFRCFVKLQELMLSGNSLIDISSAMFEGLENLKSLSLSRNKIRFLNASTFDNLVNLEVLDISRNQLNYNNRSMPHLVFENLVHLRQLYLQGNVNNRQLYPSLSLSRLSQLTSLYIDVNVGSKLGPEVKTLKRLTTLVFGGHTGYCGLRNITKDFLENTPYLRTLIIFGCNLYHIDPAVFSSVKVLETLEISKTRATYDLYQAFDDLRGLINSSLKNLKLISLSQSNYLCRALTKTHAAYLQHLALEELNLSQNRIALIGKDFVELLPRTLKRFVLMDNKLSNRVFSLISLSQLSEMTEIYLDRQDDSLQSYQLTETNRDDFYDQNLSYMSLLEEYHLDSNKSIPKFAANESFLRFSDSGLCVDSDQSFTAQDDPQRDGLPPKLRLVQATRFYFFDMSLLRRNWRFNNSLTSIRFTNNFLVRWGEWTLPSKIQNADLSHNYAMKLTESFFRPNNSLISLNISNNILGESFAALDSGKVFSRLGYLRFLDISMNLLYKLPRGFLSGLKSLEVLLATNNKLQALNLSLSHMSSVWLMNFSQNSITWIDKVTRDDLDFLALSKTVSLDISFNPLPCTCDGVEVLIWMAFTNVRLVNQMYLKCQTNTGEIVSFGDLQERAEQVQRACASKAIVLVISISSAVVVTLMVTLALVYRFRWKLRYLRNIALAKYAGFKPKKVTGKKFPHDAYILYEDQTINFVFNDFIQELEVKRGHRLLLVDRDIMPGTYMTTAILSAVQNSYKTIPVVSPYFFDGLYSEYAVKMAVMEEIYEPRPVLYLCLYQPTDHEGMSKDLLSIMQRNQYTEFPPDPDINEDLVKQFWDQLSNVIQQRD
ncbi:toll-like receptor 3 [Biomphalaria pfeifferi]|uniref:Toll-like receptor 3 n=1 Tax=Biomphalaria pfeifferi TaxID=112525 RepID=A0AAD8BI69_BIOPF|nr:toll-like receptor 3 [Biomphalaria pfeifferi]